MKTLLVIGALGAAMAAGGASPDGPIETTRTMVQDTAGKGIFTGKGLCAACHGTEGKGTALAPDLTDAKWLNVDGSLDAIAKLVKEGVPNPKEHPAPMPAMGGAQLTDAEIQAVARYVKSLSAKAGG